MHVVASGDYGHTFADTEIPKLTPPAGYGDAWRIGYKLATAPDGSAYVAGYQLDMKSWSLSLACSPRAATGNVGRIAFGVSRLKFDRSARPADPRPERPRDARAGDRLEPRLDARAQGRERRPRRALLGDRPRRGRGRPHLLRASPPTDGSGSSRATTTAGRGGSAISPQASAIGGLRQRSMRPELVAGGGFVAVLFHTVDASGTNRKAGNAAAVTFDRGATWVGPRLINRQRWRDPADHRDLQRAWPAGPRRAAGGRPDGVLRVRRRSRRPLGGVRGAHPRHAAHADPPPRTHPDADPGALAGRRIARSSG